MRWLCWVKRPFEIVFQSISGRGDGRVVRWFWVNFQCRDVLQIWIIVGQGPIALAVDADGGCLYIFTLVDHFFFLSPSMALGNLPVPGRPTIWMIVGQGPTALAVGAGGGCLDIFTLIYPFSPLSPSLWETARYRLKYCLKGPLNPFFFGLVVLGLTAL